MSLAEVEDFQQCLDICVLEEMPLFAWKYTWSNKQKGNIFFKIDWVFMNGD